MRKKGRRQTYHSSVAAGWAKRAHVGDPAGSQQSAKGGTQGRVDKAQRIVQRAQHAHGHIVGRDIGTEPQQGHLHVVGGGHGPLAMLRWDALDSVRLDEFERGEAVIEAAKRVVR